jgi:hypothetical protein
VTRLSLALLTLGLVLASHANADEPKVYRWVGEDGRVYTSTTPPPNGKGLIDSAPASKPKPEPEAKPADATAPRRTLRQILTGDSESVPVAPSTIATSDETSCARFRDFVDDWRKAKRAVEAAEASVDRLQSETDYYVRRNDSYYDRRLEAAEQAVSRAEERLNQVESDAADAGVPQKCFTD